MRRCMSFILSLCMLVSTFTVKLYAEPEIHESKSVKATGARQMEYLTRGAIGAEIDGNVYLTWRLLGSELDYSQ